MKDRREYVKQWRAKKGRTYINDYRRGYYQEHKQEVLLYQKTHLYIISETANETHKEICRKWKAANPEKVKAGSLARSVSYFESCELCGEVHNLDKHHPDYSEPWIIITLCRACHIEVHAHLLKELLQK